jgi:hypothetical protein
LAGIKRKPSEAEIQLGDELIRKLAPECAQGNLILKKKAPQLLGKKRRCINLKLAKVIMLWKKNR